MLIRQNASNEYDIFHYCYFLDEYFKFEPYACNGYRDLMQKAMNFNDAAIVSFKRNDYRTYFWYITDDHSINIIKKYNLNRKSGLLAHLGLGIKNEYFLS